GYDLVNNKVFETDLNGDKTAYTYDGLYRAVQTDVIRGGYLSPASLSPTDIVTEMSYDLVGNKLSATDANNHATVYGYDNVYRLTSTTDAAGNTVAYTYDAAGNVIDELHKSNGTATYEVTYPEAQIDGLNRAHEKDQVVFLGDPTA